MICINVRFLFVCLKIMVIALSLCMKKICLIYVYVWWVFRLSLIQSVISVTMFLFTKKTEYMFLEYHNVCVNCRFCLCPFTNFLSFSVYIIVNIFFLFFLPGFVKNFASCFLEFKISWNVEIWLKCCGIGWRLCYHPVRLEFETCSIYNMGLRL